MRNEPGIATTDKRPPRPETARLALQETPQDGHAMKTVILAGGLGTRLAEETEARPKPMVEIGGRPILWHIMRHYAAHWFTEFVVALGYRADVVKRYFLDYSTLTGSLSVNLARGEVSRHDAAAEDWTVHL